MRYLLFSALLFIAVSNWSLAETDTKANSNGKTANPIGHKAPIGHLQPTQKSLPPEVLRREQNGNIRERQFDRKIHICKGC